MPSSTHEAVLDVARSLACARALLRDAIDAETISSLDLDAARIIDVTVPQLVAPSRLCDLVVEVPLRRPPAEGPRGAALIIEVQERKDRGKELSWPVYWANVRARPSISGGLVWLAVITTSRPTAEWATAVLADVMPRAGRWLVLGPSTMKRITDPYDVVQNLDLAILSALIHAGEHDEDLVPAIATALSTLPRERGILYYDVLSYRLSSAAVAALEEQMQKSGYVWQSEFAIRHRAEGRLEGQLEGLRGSLLMILRARGFVVSEQVQVLIAECVEPKRLEDWLRRAANATSIAEVLGSAPT